VVDDIYGAVGGAREILEQCGCQQIDG